MKKLISIIVLSFIFTLTVNGASLNTNIYDGDNIYECTNLQDKGSISTNDIAYYSYCMKVDCKNRNYNIEFYSKSNSDVVCYNGNTNPYQSVAKNGCNDYQQTQICNENEIKYCTMILKYDCNRKSDGTLFTTTTTTRTTTTKTTTTKRPTTKNPTTNTTTVTPSNTKLKVLALSNGSINFNSDVYEYNIVVTSDVTDISVSALPIDENSTVSITGNENIINGSVIIIKVTGTDGSFSEYKINVSKAVNIIKSNNKNLKKLDIKGYNINFSPTTYEYDLTIQDGIDKLDIDYEPQDTLARVTITGNEELEDGKIISISVIAEDGSMGSYSINIKVKKKSKLIWILFIIVVILAVLAGGYYVYKKFIQNKNGDKYEYE